METEDLIEPIRELSTESLTDTSEFKIERYICLSDFHFPPREEFNLPLAAIPFQGFKFIIIPIPPSN